ncbi:MAG: hypothetical protein MMC33_004221 [Icmadophila ericetorum]|nr:hypothetical protein [Icmadophila ericetorum]
MAQKEIPRMNNWVYDLVLWLFSILVDLFFREVHPRGSWKIPRRGPLIFVAAPHANQFVDPLILMRVVRTEARRRFAILTAEKSMRRKFIGAMARAVGAVPVARAMDMTRAATGKIYLPDPFNDPVLVKGVGTQFDKECQIGGLIALPTVKGTCASADIGEIFGPEELRLKKGFKGADALRQLTGRDDISEDGKIMNGGGHEAKVLADGYQGTPFKAAPKVDQTKVYDAVFDRLNQGGCVCIFPEGGSHDRTELLPLKAGVAIMALGSLAANPDSGLKIIPCGMNYFHAHKFRSRAVVEFGAPIEVPRELVNMYRDGERREATRQLLEIIYQSLVAVTVTSPDYETLMLIQAARRLYNPTGKKLPLPLVVELNRRLVKGYTHYKDDPRIIGLKKAVNDYNKQLWRIGLRDHQVEYAKFSVAKVVFTLTYRLGKLAIMSIGTLPGLVLFAPVFAASKIISIRKSREALAASTVKLQGRDVMATWKLLVAMAFAPMLYAFYTILLTYWTYRNRVQGYIPEWVPLWMVVIFSMIVFPSITFAALRFGETGMDILKSIRPLYLSLNPSQANTLVKLRATRERLSAEVTDLINTLGPELFPDFDHVRLIADPFREGMLERPKTPTSPRTPASPSHQRFNSGDGVFPFPTLQPLRRNQTAEAFIDGGSSAHGHLPRNESFSDLSNMGLFATRPPSRSRSRNSSSGNLAGMNGGNPTSHSHSHSMKGFSTITSKESLEEVSLRIRGAMQERGKNRRRVSHSTEASEGSWDALNDDGSTSGGVETGTGTGTPEEGKKEA